jgi:hypothetical protein
MIEFIIMVFKDGGLFFTLPIFGFVIIIIGLWIKATRADQGSEKLISLMAHIGWFALAWGYLGRTNGLIEGFDSVAQTGEYAPYIVSAALKKALIGPLFGLITFLAARLGIIILKIKQKDHTVSD